MSRPFLKWAGGKTQLLRPLLAALPARIDRYFEPFVGGGAVFFALAAEGRFQHAVISDTNQDLMLTYEAVRSNVEAVISELRSLPYDESTFYAVRSWKPPTHAAHAARFIYLNKTCFNGLYRVNRRGEFNVPFGTYINPTVCDEETLRAASAALQRTAIACLDFEALIMPAKPGDAVYFDPPYLPLSETSNFTAYDKNGFDLAEHERLARVFGVLRDRGVAAVLTNSSAPEALRLYERYERTLVKASRMINSKGARRGKVDELLVTNGVVA